MNKAVNKQQNIFYHYHFHLHKPIILMTTQKQLVTITGLCKAAKDTNHKCILLCVVQYFRCIHFTNVLDGKHTAVCVAYGMTPDNCYILHIKCLTLNIGHGKSTAYYNTVKWMRFQELLSACYKKICTKMYLLCRFQICSMSL